MPKYLDENGLSHFWSIVKAFLEDKTRSILNVGHVETTSSNTEPHEQPSDGSLLLKQNVLEIDAVTNGNRSGHNNALCTNVNNYGNRAINIGLAQTQAAADFVANSVVFRDVPYTSVIPSGQILSVSADGIEFALDVSDLVATGNVLWLTESMNRLPSTYQSAFRKYDDVFVSQTYAGLVTSVDGGSVSVDAWYELPWSDNRTPSGTSTPSIDGDVKCFVNPLNGIYGHYDLLRVPSGVPNGYKLYHSQTHILNEADEAVYSNGDIIVFESGNNGYGYAASHMGSTGRLDAAFHCNGYVNYLLKGGFNADLPEYRRLIETIGFTTGGTVQSDCLHVEGDNTGLLQDILTRQTTMKYQPNILRLASNQVIDVEALLPNAEYKFIIVGDISLTINNDSKNTILPFSTNVRDTRIDIPANGSITIKRSTFRNAHNMIRLIYVVPPRQSAIGQYPNTTIRDLIATIEVATPSDYTFTTA